MVIQGVPLTSSTKISKQESMQARRGGWINARWSECIMTAVGMNIRRPIVPLFVIVVLAVLPLRTRSQALASSGDSSRSTASTTSANLDLTYIRPTQKAKVNNYVFDAIGPHQIAGVALAADVNQWTDSVPEWNQGTKGYSRRLGSDFGIATVSTTARYGLAQAFRQDTLYYRCECNGVLPRLRHAAISTLTGRQGEDGHRVFSVPALVAPYAGSMTAVYAWYPNRYGPKDGFRMGNYSLLLELVGDVGLEFFYSGPRSLLSRMHLSSGRGAPDPGPNH
jgi:hypothetical protein